MTTPGEIEMSLIGFLIPSRSGTWSVQIIFEFMLSDSMLKIFAYTAYLNIQQRGFCTTAGAGSRGRKRFDAELEQYTFSTLMRCRFETVTFFVAGWFGVASIVFKKVTVPRLRRKIEV